MLMFTVAIAIISKQDVTRNNNVVESKLFLKGKHISE